MQLYILVIAMVVDVILTKPLVDTDHNNHILRYKTDTHSRQESGRPGQSVKGSYSFLGGDGRMYTVNYIADEKGFRAQGAHLPWSLPVDINQVLQSEVLLLDVQDDQVNPQLVDGMVTLPKDPVVIVESQPEIIKGEIAIKPADIELIKDKDEVLKGQDTGAIKKKNPTQQVFSKDRATEKLTIHVPLFTKVYSLSKSPKSVSKSIGKGSQPSRIIRYKLAFQPAFGGNVLTPLSD